MASEAERGELNDAPDSLDKEQQQPRLDTEQQQPQLESEQLQQQLQSKQLQPQLQSEQLQPQLQSTQLQPQLQSEQLQPQSDFVSAFTEGRESLENNAGPSSANQSALPQTLFYIKRFKTALKEQPIILQSVNGPCPLIAIVNCLLLQQRVELSVDSECITASSLCSLLGNYLLDRAHKCQQDKVHSEQYILDCMERFVQIQTGIDVNVRFNSVEGFEYTPELSLFDLAQVRLLHGWVADPQDKFLSHLIGDLTYNQLVEKTMDKSSSSDTRDVSESLVLREHLESSQLTVHGICEINSSLKSGDIVVLFRNNHFSTITKQKERLYVLVTDIGWAEEVQVVWETLDSTCNSSSFVDGYFNLATTSSEKTNVLADEVGPDVISAPPVQSTYFLVINCIFDIFHHLYYFFFL